MLHLITQTLSSTLSQNIDIAIERAIKNSVNKAGHMVYAKAYQSLLGTISIMMKFSYYTNSDADMRDIQLLIRRLNPVKFNKNVIQTHTSSDAYNLRANIRYIITLSKINAYILVDTTDPDEGYSISKACVINLYFFGQGRNRAYRLFTNTLNKHVDIANKKIAIIEVDENDYRIIHKTTVKNEHQLFYDQDILYKTINYLDTWKKATKFFDDLNLTQKLGILLYGPPGTGKTSFAKSIAWHFDIPLIIVDIINFSSNTIENIRNYIRITNCKYAVILLEDIDCIFTTRDKLITSKEKSAAQLLLQFLDGVSSLGNIIYIATTNHKDRLDPALIRDGRFDKKIELNNISKEKAIEMCASMYVESKTDILLQNEKFPINPAYLQNKILSYIFDHLDEIDIKEEVKRDEPERSTTIYF